MSMTPEEAREFVNGFMKDRDEIDAANIYTAFHQWLGVYPWMNIPLDDIREVAKDRGREISYEEAWGMMEVSHQQYDFEPIIEGFGMTFVPVLERYIGGTDEKV